MYTTAKIGITNNKGTIESVFCRLGGEIENAGLLLFNNYNNYDLARKLVFFGDIFKLNKYIDKGIYDNGSKDETTIYDTRDRNSSYDLSKRVYNRTVNSYLNACREMKVEYAYLFDKKNNKWLCYDIKENQVYRLEDKLRELGCIETTNTEEVKKR